MQGKKGLKKLGEKNSLSRGYSSKRKTASEQPHPSPWRRFIDGFSIPDGSEGGVLDTSDYKDIGQYLATADNYIDRVSDYIKGKRKKVWKNEIFDAVDSYNTAMKSAISDLNNYELAKQIHNRALKQLTRLLKETDKSDMNRLTKLPNLEDVFEELYELPKQKNKRVAVVTLLGLSLLCIGIISMKPTGAVIGFNSSNIFGGLAFIFVLIALSLILRKR